MAKKNTPIITHTEIIARAIRTIEAEIEEWHSTCANLPQEQRDAMIATATAELVSKLETLKQMYFIETGEESL